MAGIKVSQAVIDEIKKKGMTAAIAEANSGGASAEFNEGAKRMYGNRVKAAGPKGGSDPDSKSTTTESVTMPASAPAAASRRSGTKTTAEQALGTKNAESARKVTTHVSNIGASLASQRAMNADSVGKALGSMGKKLGLNNPFKARKRK